MNKFIRVQKKIIEKCENAAGAGEIPQNNEAIEDIQRQIQEDMKYIN